MPIFRVYYKDDTAEDVNAPSMQDAVEHLYTYRRDDFDDISKWEDDGCLRILPLNKEWPAIPGHRLRKSKVKNGKTSNGKLL